MDALVIPAGLIGGLAVAGFLVAVLAAAVTPVLSRFDRLAAWRGPLTLVPFGLLLVGALLAGASTALGAVSTHSVGVREVATGALAVMCLTPIIGVAAVRLRYGAPGRRLFQQQIAANRASSVLLVAVMFELVAITGFLIGGTVGFGFGSALTAGLVLAGLSIVVTVGATAFAIFAGDDLVLDLSKARDAGPGEQQLRNVVAELATAAGLPSPRVYVIEVKAPNALSVGRDSSRATIAVTRGLLDRLDREELQGVIAHELAHIANLDSRHAVLVALLVGAIVLLTDVFFALIIEIAKNPWTGDDLSDTLAALGLWLVVVVVGFVVAGSLRLLAPLAALAVQAAVSRDREYLADATAVGITRNASGLIGALRKLDRVALQMPDANRGMQHLWIVNPVRESREGERGWFATHPAIADRIARLRTMAGLGDEAEREKPGLA
ncbi:MAG: M48 family metalloprotease [Chloroflexota bacterium]|nr:M48 family metalloprotease [Chloroflexota bacterium]